MQYKTIVMDLIQQNRALHDEWVRNRRLLSETTRLATQLRSDHLNLVEQFQQQFPETAESLLSSQALEIVTSQLQADLQHASASDSETFSLDAAMAFVAQHTPRKSPND